MYRRLRELCHQFTENFLLTVIYYETELQLISFVDKTEPAEDL